MPGAVYQAFPMLGRSRAQVWEYSRRYRRPRHFHSEPELNLVVAGSATFGVGHAVKVLHAGDLIGFTPGQDHELLGGSRDLVLFAIGLRRTLSREVLRGAEDAVLAPLQVRLSDDSVRSLVARCSDASGHADAEQATLELWQAAQSACRAAAPVSAHVLTRRALVTLDGAPELGRSALAASARAGASEVSRHFHRDLGLTLVEYRTRVRLLRLVEHVDRGASLTAAALDAGFGSYSQCHRVFQRTFGCAPRDFFHTDVRRRVEDAFAPAEPADLHAAG
jgi:methylphosphotriester-DNA--protein-cysteine methyltransferase